MYVTRRFSACPALGALCAAATGSSAPAAAYPTKPIMIVGPIPAGAGPDVMARMIGDRLSTNLNSLLNLGEPAPLPPR